MGQYSLDGSLVKRNVKDIPDLLRDGSAREPLPGSLINNEADDLGGNFIGFGFASGFADQSGEALRAECIEGLVERFSGVAEFCTYPGKESMLMAVCPKHLVYDLGRVFRIEEVGDVEQFGFDRFWLMLHGELRRIGIIV